MATFSSDISYPHKGTLTYLTHCPYACCVKYLRTTIRLRADLLEAAKRYALENESTFTAVVEAALAEKLTKLPKPSIITFHGKLQPGVNLDNNAEVLELMEEGLDIYSRR